MTQFVAASAFLATLSLGLAAGALLAEGALLVPFWRSLSPDAFLAWYRQHASLLVRFFGSLEIASTLCVAAAALSAALRGDAGRLWLGMSAALAFAVLAAFPLYFQKANASFAEATIELENVAGELQRWSAWHAGRTLLAVGAFALAAIGFAK